MEANSELSCVKEPGATLETPADAAPRTPLDAAPALGPMPGLETLSPGAASPEGLVHAHAPGSPPLMASLASAPDLQIDSSLPQPHAATELLAPALQGPEEAAEHFPERALVEEERARKECVAMALNDPLSDNAGLNAVRTTAASPKPQLHIRTEVPRATPCGCCCP